MKPPGIALTAHPVLRQAVNKLCSVRTKKVGALTRLVRDAHKAAVVAKNANRKRKAKEDFDEAIRLKTQRAEKRDKADYTALKELITDVKALNTQLEARQGSKKARLLFLSEQFHARVSCRNPRLYPGLGCPFPSLVLFLHLSSLTPPTFPCAPPSGDEFRNKFGKLRVTPKDKSLTTEKYMVRLIQAMIREDQDVIGVNSSRTNNSAAEFIRVLPSISSTATNPKAIALKAELTQHICILATPIDDPVYLQLQARYQGSILYDNETRASQKLFRVVAIQYVQSYTAGRFSCWEATCEPIYRDAAAGKFVVPPELLVEGSGVVQKNALVGYALAEYPNGSDSEPTFLPWLDNYVNHFKNIIEPRYVSCMSQDSPSTPPTSLVPCTSKKRSRTSKRKTT
jgi:hypothetical protein